MVKIVKKTPAVHTMPFAILVAGKLPVKLDAFRSVYRSAVAYSLRVRKIQRSADGVTGAAYTAVDIYVER